MATTKSSLKAIRTVERLGKCNFCEDPAECADCSCCGDHCDCESGPVEFDADELGLNPEDDDA